MKLSAWQINAPAYT